MSDLLIGNAQRARRNNFSEFFDRHIVWVAAFFGVLVFAFIQFATHMPGGFPNSDDILRLVHVRDLLAGQSWFDPVQYRLGLEGGTVMHWAKLVDAPIALLVLWGGENFAAFAWPLILAFLSIAAVAFGTVKLAGRDARFPAVVIAVTALWSVGVFSPGSFDHHNVQATLLLWAIALFVGPNTSHISTSIAGLCCALMLAIGMETLPHVAALGIWAAITFAFGSLSVYAARGFGAGLALSSVALFPSLIGPSQWLSTNCDSFSTFHVTLAVIGGGGLAAASFALSAGKRMIILGVAALAGAAAITVFFPHCLANPISGLPPLLREFWLDGVVETRSAVEMFRTDPFSLIGFFALPVIGLVVCIFGLRHEETRLGASLLLSVLVVAIAITSWQQRGFVFAALVAMFPMTVALTKARLRYEQSKKIPALAGMVFFWIASINVVWFVLSAQMASAFSSAPTLQEQIATADPSDYCYEADLYAALRAEPKGAVLSSTNTGPMVIAHTHHRALAGPYHRNVDGNMRLIEIMLASSSVAKKMVDESGITHIADCINDPDTRDFKKAAPDGFQSALHASPERFDWLEIIPSSVDQPLRIFRVIE
ncbi:MAG: hypothetical protein AAGG69_12350 [Pseudomonadota bacterium]